MKIAIIGKNGFIGSHLFKDLNSKFEVIGTTLPDLDITNQPAVEEFVVKNKFSHIILVAGSKDVKKLEQNQEFANNINVKPVSYFSNAIKKAGLGNLILFSTDYVFDGKKGNYTDTDKTCPNSVYGKTKVEAENILKASCIDYTIIRTSSVLGSQSVFFDWLTNALKTETELDMFKNSFITPTCVSFLSDVISAIIENSCSKKLLHVVQEQKFNRYQLAKFIKSKINSKCNLIPSDCEYKDLSLIQSDFVKSLNLPSFEKYLERELCTN